MAGKRVERTGKSGGGANGGEHRGSFGGSRTRSRVDAGGAHRARRASGPQPAAGARGRRRKRAALAGPNLARLKLHSVHDRRHLAQVAAFAGTPEVGVSFAAWMDSLPAFLGVKRLRAAVAAIVAARRAERPVAMAMGGHVVKVGCGPVVIDLCRREIVTAVVCHGATAIHDVEIAMIGATSEDVGDTIRDGRFGMVRETAEFFAAAAKLAERSRIGYGRAIGQLVLKRRLAHASRSILAAAAELDLPATVHVAIGTDTVHMPTMADGALIGRASMADFRLLCGVVHDMGAAGKGGVCGVWCNVGSAVILPEVFLKTVAVARNLGAKLDDLTTVNLDMLRQYRTGQNVVGRPVNPGHGHDIAGHHEIMLPLLRQAVIEAWSRRTMRRL
ncbi:MAG TPA: hypothetical protein PKY77_02850 [Phycisphaerae bacterium]|nr:hypothetical protein [Phycisphaerae bacterium]HRY66684.1 hypothetical protein [Phycisphaerae bacterium]HSA27613.1 hypothetical protein [Phycisphaerae bacterium]